jgi:uncharacterized membrane protein
VIDRSIAEQLFYAREPFRYEVWATAVSLLVCIVERMVLSGAVNADERVWSKAAQLYNAHAASAAQGGKYSSSKAGMCVRMEVMNRGRSFFCTIPKLI